MTTRKLVTRTITTSRITTRVVLTDDAADTPTSTVLFMHGNAGTVKFWEDLMLTLPAAYSGIAFDVRGFGQADINAKIDATRGLQDLADDAFALLDELKVEKCHIVAHSASGAVALYMLADRPHVPLSLCLIATVSPYGMGGSRTDGTPCFSDCAGSGGGTIPAMYVDALRNKSRSDEVNSPRFLLNNLLFNAPFRAAREEEYLDALFEMHLGDKDYPGDSSPSSNWPGFAPGKYGLVNAFGFYLIMLYMAPIYARDLSSVFNKASPKPAILWVPGKYDSAVQDGDAVMDLAVVAEKGMIPNYPGRDVFPPQQTLTQIRHFLGKYTESGGKYTEVALETGHFPHIEGFATFNPLLHEFLNSNTITDQSQNF